MSSSNVNKSYIKNIYTELEVDEFKDIRNRLNNEILIVKFSANWCVPCRKIKSCCEEWFAKLPSNVILFDIDIDETMDLYMALKKWKMVDGIPAILAFHTPAKDNKWFIPDDSITGGDVTKIQAFFLRCQYKAYSLCNNLYVLDENDNCKGHCTGEHYNNYHEDNDIDPKEKKEKENKVLDEIIAQKDVLENESDNDSDNYDIEEDEENECDNEECDEENDEYKNQ